MDVPDSAMPTLDEIVKILAELEAAGAIKRNGEYRRGLPVYVITELGKTELSKETDFPEND
jgi:hypothetical protein